MAVKLALAELTFEEKIQLATNIDDSMTGNPTYPAPGPVAATIGNLTPGTRYWFRVAAVGAAGQSPWSSPVTPRAGVFAAHRRMPRSALQPCYFHREIDGWVQLRAGCLMTAPKVFS